MKIIKATVEEFKDKKLTKANKHLLGITNSDKRDELLFTRFKNADEYEKGADELAAAEIDNKKIFGFISEKYYIKYDKVNNELVMYIPNSEMKSGNQLISYFKPGTGTSYYNKLKQDHYTSEIS